VEAAAPAVEAPAGAEEAARATPEATGSSSTDGFGGHGQ
jgi:hypothetical protein